MRIGITGTFSGGKDLVGEYLASLGFYHVATGDLVREEATRRGISWSRVNLQKLGNTLREENGADYLTRVALTMFPNNVAVSGIRNRKEMNGLDWSISINAPRAKRFIWAKERRKLTDDVDFDSFVKQEQYEMGHDEKGLQLGDVMAAADISIWNGGTKEDIYRQVDSALERFR